LLSARVLLTEGSSLTAREVVSCLGPAGHHIEVMDPDSLCLARISRWVRKLHRCPHAGSDPLGYLRRLADVVAARMIDVVLPTHEQAWLLSVGRRLLPERVRYAAADAAAFAQVQSKVAFARLLDELGLPQPRWRPVSAASDLADLAFPYWLKRAFSTAGQGVRAVTDARSRDEAARALLADGEAALVQDPAPGQYGQVQALFDRGRMVAVHTNVQRATGVGGSAAARLSVDHPAPREHVAALGEALGWHGGITLDYMHENGSPRYIECNPRTVEPGNAAASGVNLPDLQVRLTLGEELERRVGRPGVRTHGTLALLLGAAARGAGRRGVLAELANAVGHRGVYAESSEQLTPVRADPPSVVPLAVVAGRVLTAPDAASRIAAEAVSRYAIDAAAVAVVEGAR
jgi:predicted ATP-grasp superfamily ATP-dependent carboligase